MARSRLSTLTSFDRESFLADLLSRVGEAKQLSLTDALLKDAAANKPTRPTLSFQKEKSSPDAVSQGLPSKDDSHLRAEPHRYVIGVDEVGRGCLAGPVVACAVILPLIEPRSGLARKLSKLDDSKLIPAPVREELDEVIRGSAHFAVAESSPAEIDEINILNASLLAMRRAVHEILERLSLSSGDVLVLVDGNRKIKEFIPRQKTVIQGDSKSAAIAAASVVAKVHRDSFMRQLAEEFPQYLWHSNKGYGSRAHRAALVTHGVTSWHRQSFRLFYDGEEAGVVDEDGGIDDLELQLKFEAAL
jgi:ribonuclease HII